MYFVFRQKLYGLTNGNIRQTGPAGGVVVREDAVVVVACCGRTGACEGVSSGQPLEETSPNYKSVFLLINSWLML